MNENIDLTKILKDCPKGTKLYSTVWGDVYLHSVGGDSIYQIGVTGVDKISYHSFTSNGKMWHDCDGECILFPSRDQRDWSKFTIKKPKFDPKALKPFDNVLVRNCNWESWRSQLFSHILEGGVLCPYLCINTPYIYCIPYNEETKHLVGTNEEAPEYYRYWED